MSVSFGSDLSMSASNKYYVCPILMPWSFIQIYYPGPGHTILGSEMCVAEVSWHECPVLDPASA